MKFTYVSLIFALSVARAAVAESVITNLCDISDACQCLTNLNRHFSVSGRLVLYYRRPKTHEWIFEIAQDGFALRIFEFNGSGHPAVNIARPQLNDLIRLSGVLYEYQGGAYPGYTEACVLSTAPADDLIFQSPKPCEIFKRMRPGQLLRISGTIRDFFRDESDPGYIHMSMVCDGEILHAMIQQPAEDSIDPALYVGKHAMVTGIGSDAHNGLRKHVGHVLLVSGTENIVVSDSRSCVHPELDAISAVQSPLTTPAGLVRTEGDVLCVWHPHQALIRTKSGNIAKVGFVGKRLPQFGQKILVCGIPETDLYFLNLVNATWKSSGEAKTAASPLENISPRSLLVNDAGYPMIKIREHGKTIHLTGIVRYLPRSSNIDSRFHIESDGCLVPVDVGVNRDSLKELVVGSKVSVTGVCVLDIDSYGIGTSIPQARGFFLVLRTPNDLAILSRPSWWTPLRLLIVIGALGLVLIAVAVWNLALKRLAERRGRELADEQVGHVTSELKVYERTHLAVELHDALSQTLSGVSLQIDAVGRFAETDKARMLKHLDIAAKTLKSCRDELRNCLLDLRSSALEETDMNVAIRRTLAPSSDGIDIAVRFDVPRDLFSDNTAHTILRIIRELVANAIRHGHADKIKVAGSIENDVLKFSVRDNGCGFDPDKCPGIADGHFGLQGIRERIESYEGSFTLSCKPGSGCKATVAIRLPSTSEKELSNG